MSEPIRVDTHYRPPDKDPDGKNYPKIAMLARWVIKADDEVKAAREMVVEIIEELRPLEVAHATAVGNNETAKANKLAKKVTATQDRLRSAEKARDDAEATALDYRNEMTETRAEARRLQRELIAKDERLAAWSKTAREKVKEAEKKIGNLDRGKERIASLCRKLARLIEEVPAAVQGEVDAAEMVKAARVGLEAHRDGNTADLAGLTVEEAQADLNKGSERVTRAQRAATDATSQWCELQAAIFATRKELRRDKRRLYTRAPAIEAEAKAARSRLRDGLLEYERRVQGNRDRLQRLVGVEAEGVRGIDPVAVIEAVGGEVPPC